MGMFADVETFCFVCKKPAFSQTKVPDDLYMQTIRPGDVFCRHDTPFASSVIRLKDACLGPGGAYGSDVHDLAIELQNGVYTRAEPAERATWAEGPWGSVDPVEAA